MVDLSSLTQRQEIDQEAAKQKLAAVQAAESKVEADLLARKKALAKIKVAPADRDFLMQELLLSKEDAIQALRVNGLENGGTPVLEATLRHCRASVKLAVAVDGSDSTLRCLLTFCFRIC